MATTRSRDNRKREKPGRFGTDIITYSDKIGTLLETATFVQILGTPYPPTDVDAYYLERLSVGCLTVAAPTSGTCVGKFQKARGGSGGTVIDVTATFSMTSSFFTSTESYFDVPILSTLTQAQFAFLQGDALLLSVATQSAITTQPVAVVCSEFAAGA